MTATFSPPSLRRPVGLRRSWLFTAGADASAQAQALASHPDVLVADLEEFTAAAQRPLARTRIAALMQQCRAERIVAAVRINRLAHDGLEDLQGVMPGGPDAVFLPCVDSAEEIRALDEAITAQERALGLSPGSTEIVPTIESARGLVALAEILAASARVQACLLAAEDLSADLGAERGPDSLELNHLRSRFHVECRAAERLSIDCPFNYLDVQAQQADLLWARRIGLRAKCTVFPEQVATIHAVLTPCEARIAHAQEVVARFEQTRQGAAPDYHTARRLLARAAEFKAWGDGPV